MKIKFWGATEGVTGSMTLLEFAEGKILVDCGLYQGESQEKNLKTMALPCPAQEIKAVVLTHAHLDHSGYLPRLVRDGFHGPIFCTEATRDLTWIILADSAHIQKGQETPLYDAEDVNSTRSLFKTKSFLNPFSFLNQEITFIPAGHILGAASVLFKGEKSVLFSGDLGRQNDPVMLAPSPSVKADIVVMESTYGDRVRSGNLENELHSFLVKVHQQKKIALIASFAVARGQMLMTLIHHFYERHPEYKSKVIVDSPMMKEANKVYKRFSEMTKHPDELYEALDKVSVVEGQRQGEQILHKEGPLIVLTSSGMVSGGRIWHYLKEWQSLSNTILYLPGYQGVGTAGRELAQGKRHVVGPRGVRVDWEGEVGHSDAFSSHADQHELLQWITPNLAEAKIFLIHGEEQSKLGLEKCLKENGARSVTLPKHGEVF